MAFVFYPHEDQPENATLEEKLETLMDAAEKYKAVVLDLVAKSGTGGLEMAKRATPKEIPFAYNWEEITRVLRAIRELPEGTSHHKLYKAQSLNKLAEVYEVLRAAKMPKLEAVRIALSNEATQLKSGEQAA